MSSGGLLFTLSGFHESKENNERSLSASSCELVRDPDGTYWLNLDGNVSEITVEAEPSGDILFERFRLELMLLKPPSVVSLVGAQATLKKLERAIRSVLKKEQPLNLQREDAERIRTFARKRAMEMMPVKPNPKPPPKPAAKPISRGAQAIAAARGDRLPLSPISNQTSPTKVTVHSPKKLVDTSLKRAREMADDPIEDADEKDVKPLVQRRLFINDTPPTNQMSEKWQPQQSRTIAPLTLPSSTSATTNYRQTVISNLLGFRRDKPPDTERYDGFRNLGNTCYLNAVLQSLTSLHLFAADLLQKSSGPAKPEFFSAYVEILRQKKQSVNKVINPEPVKKAIASHVHNFAGYNQQDAHEFMVSCLTQLEEDLMPPKPKRAASAAAAPGETNGKSEKEAEKVDDAMELLNEDVRLDEATKPSETNGKTPSPKKSPAPATSPKRTTPPPSPKRLAAAPSSPLPPPPPPPPPPPSASSPPPLPSINLSDPVSKNFDTLVEHTLRCKSCNDVTAIRELHRDFSLEFPSPPPKPTPTPPPPKPEAVTTELKLEDDDVNLLNTDVFAFNGDEDLFPRPAPRPTLRLGAMLESFFQDEELDRNCEKCKGKTAIVSHRFYALPRILVLHLKRFKVDLDLQVMRKIGERVVWEKELDVTHLCAPDARNPSPLPEPEREQANQVAAEIASSDPLNASADNTALIDDDDPEADLKRALALSKKDFEHTNRERLLQKQEEDELAMAMKASLREARQSSRRYVLQSVVNHIGQSASSGHYVSDVRDPISKQWRRFNDSISTEVKEADVFSSETREKEGYIFFFVHETVLAQD